MKKSLVSLMAAAVAISAILTVQRAPAQGPTAAAIETAPIGSIVAWAGPKNKIPDGWRECNGALVNKNDFPVLADRIGTYWGSTATDKIALPDLAGYFLRGVDDSVTGVKRDPDPGKRRPTGGGTPTDVGSTQPAALQDHTHALPSKRLEASGGSGFEGNGHDSNSNPNGNFGGARNSEGVRESDLVGGETRPANAYVYWIIRVK